MKDWIKLKFGEIAENIVEIVPKPNESGLSDYIGLDELDTDQIRIKRFASTQDVNAPKFLCKKGDIIFGKRNAYLRKVAVSDRDAVASAHSMILRPKTEWINKDFLPCLMQSSLFWKIAHSISEGSMSPTIKWGALSKQEFIIPPLGQQQKIASFLWSIEKNMQYSEEIIDLLSNIKTEILNKFFNFNKKNKISKLGEVIDLNFGIRIVKSKDKGTKYPVYGGGGESFRTDNFNRENEYVISRFAMSEECVRFVAGKFYLLDSGLTFSIKKELSKEVLKDYVGTYLMNIQRKIFACSRGPAQKNLDVSNFKDMDIPLVSIGDQKRVIDIITFIDKTISECKTKIDTSNKLKKSLTDKLISGEIILK